MGKTYKIGSTNEKETLAYAANMEVNPSESVHIVEIAMTGAGTLNLGEDSLPVPGDRLIVKATSDGTARDLTFGTNITGPVLAGVINKTLVQEFIFDGTDYIATGAPVQID